MMQVYVRMVNGDIWPIYVSPMMSVGDFKDEVTRVTDLDRNSQRLTFNGEEIGVDEGEEIASLGVSAEDVIEVSMSTEGLAKLQLIDLGVAVDGDTMVRAAATGDAPLVALLLEAGIPPDHVHSYGGETALSEACLRGHRNVVSVLLDRGADPNTPDDWGNTSMHCLAKGAIEPGMVPVLISHGGAPNLVNKKGMTPLMVAVTEGRYLVAEALVGVTDVRIKDKTGMTVLMHAARSGLWEVHMLIERLVGAGCDVNAVDVKGQAALFHAVGRAAALTTLLRFGADPTIVDISGRTLYYPAAANNDTQLIQLLLNQRVPLTGSYYPPDGTPLHLAVRSHSHDAARLLAPHCDKTIEDDSGHTPLQAYYSYEYQTWPDTTFLIP
eukprot:TRINITY_DN26615_c0_g1_i1.p1 TRINITY_DN26615_c0_g1~~TRINITY_DN26615_c0_g1_i1.p1  ORF type:complete len:382 (+),score=91.96 TRINITY_DN26615_c0_g1_i1:47-1192(+)